MTRHSTTYASQSKLKSRFKLLLVLGLAAVSTGCGLRPAPTAGQKPAPRASVSPVAQGSATGFSTGNRQLATPSPSSPNRLDTGQAGATIVPSRERKVVKSERSDLPEELPGDAEAHAASDDTLMSHLAAAEQGAGAAEWRRVADYAVELGNFELAHRAYSREAAIYRDKGHLQAAIAEEAKAAQYATEIELYRSVGGLGKVGPSRQRLEPSQGCYLGAFIDRDSSLSKHFLQSQHHGDVDQFHEMVGKTHASFFMYRAYGSPFPAEWADYLRERGAIVHIAWEPDSLDEVQDDGYLNGFLADAGALDHPVLLRFASEMNGDWTPYSGDPKNYIEKFRLVYEKTRAYPNVAMLWCPNTVPQKNIEEYYPGDDYVDWVGVNFYSVPFLDNDPSRPGDRIHPTDHLKRVYELYSHKKPIAIGEWAASQQSSLRKDPLTDFAVQKMHQLYAMLPTRYPRVKMVNWYDCNNIVQAKKERQLNNFQLTQPPVVREAYQRAISSSHFLGAGEESSNLRFELSTQEKMSLSAGATLKLALKSYDPSLKMYFLVNDKIRLASSIPSEWYLTREEMGEEGELRVVVFDSRDRFVTELKRQVSFR